MNSMFDKLLGVAYPVVDFFGLGSIILGYGSQKPRLSYGLDPPINLAHKSSLQAS